MLIDRRGERAAAGRVSVWRYWLPLWLLLGGGLSLQTAVAKERLAMVIGNSGYQNLGALNNPKNDAQAVAERLAEMGFVLIGRNGQRTEGAIYDLEEEAFLKALRGFAQKANQAEIALLYYAGHGAQIEGKSYLLPVDVPASAMMIERRSLDLDRVLAQLDGRADLTVAVFDACRDIPQLDQMERAAGFGGGKIRGLARINSKGGRSRIVAFSGSAGQTVADGGDSVSHSPYTEILLNKLGKKRVEVDKLFQGVAFEFGRRYGGQNPEVLIQGAQPGRFFFKGPAEPTPATERGVQVPGGVTVSNKAFMEMSTWGMAEKNKTCGGYRDYLKLFPNGTFVTLANERLKTCTEEGQAPRADPQEQAWQLALAGGPCAGYRTYLGDFPYGKHVAEARRRLALCQPSAETTQDPLDFVDTYYGLLGHVGYERIAELWLSPPRRLRDALRGVERFTVRSKQLISRDGESAKVLVDVEGKRWGETTPWRGHLDLRYVGGGWKLVTQSTLSSHTSRPHPSSSSDESGVLAFIDDYFKALDRADYPGVAALWDDPPRKLSSLVVNVEFFVVDKRSVTRLGNDWAVVALEVRGKQRGGRVERYKLFFDLIRRNGSWKLAKQRTQ